MSNFICVKVKGAENIEDIENFVLGLMFEHWENNKDITYRRYSRFCRRTNVRTLAGETIKFPADYQPLISAQRGPGCVKSKVLCGFGGRINRQTRQLILNQSARNCHQTRPLRSWASNFQQIIQKINNSLDASGCDSP